MLEQKRLSEVLAERLGNFQNGPHFCWNVLDSNHLQSLVNSSFFLNHSRIREYIKLKK